MLDRDTSLGALARDTSWLVAAKAAALGVSFLLPLVLVRMLTQTEFGLYKQIFLLVGTATGFLPLGFAMSAFYFLPRVGQRGGAVALNIVLVHAVVGGLMAAALVVGPTLLATIFDEPALVAHSRPVAAVLFLSVASSFLDPVAMASGRVRQAALFIVLTYLSKTAMLSAAAITYGSVRAVLVASAVHGLLQLIMLMGFLRSAFGAFWKRPDFSMLRAQIAYAVPLGLAGWLYWFQMEAHQYVVARMFGPATYALYAVGCFSLPLTAVIGESVGSVVIQRVSRLHSQARRADIVEVLARAMRGLAVLYMPLYALFLVTGPDLIAFIFTEQYRASWPIFAVNLTLMPLAILAIASDAVVRSYLECRRFLVNARILLVAALLAALWFVTPRYGPLGAITVVVGINAVERLIVAGRVAKALELGRRDASAFKSLRAVTGAAFAAGVVTAAVRGAMSDGPPAVVLLVCGAVFTATYLLLGSRLAILTPDERLLVRRELARVTARASGQLSAMSCQLSTAGRTIQLWRKAER